MKYFILTFFMLLVSGCFYKFPQCHVANARIEELDYAIDIVDAGAVAGKLIARRIDITERANFNNKCGLSYGYEE